MTQAFPGTSDERTVEDVDRHIKEANAELPPLPEPWKKVKDADGIEVPVFRAFQVRDFGRTAIAAAGGGVPQRESLVAAFLSAMEWGRDHWASFSMRGQDQREIAEQFADKVLASSPQPEAAPAVAQSKDQA